MSGGAPGPTRPAESRRRYLIPIRLSESEEHEVRRALRAEGRALIPTRALVLSWARDVAYWARSDGRTT